VGGGRYAELHLGGATYLIYPVERGSLEGQAYLLVQTMPETEDEDHRMVGELSRMLSVQWERVERSSLLLGTWEVDARSAVETTLPGTSHAVRVLRDAVIEAAKTPQPVLICGRPGVGRMTVASLLAALHARGAQNLQVLQARDDDDAFRFEFFGPEGSDGGARERSDGGMLVLRDIHLISPALQREVADAVGLDLSSGFGPSVRWAATTDDDPMRLLNDGMLEPALFNVFQRHVIRVPSIQDRREDLPLLVVKMLEEVGAEQGKIIRGIELETLNCLLAYSFDGEMTELLAELRRLVSATPSGEMVRGPVPAQRLAMTMGDGEDPTASATALLSLGRSQGGDSCGGTAGDRPGAAAHAGEPEQGRPGAEPVARRPHRQDEGVRDPRLPVSAPPALKQPATASFVSCVRPTPVRRRESTSAGTPNPS
jgi:DNA-binding NtrC family response regulator